MTNELSDEKARSSPRLRDYCWAGHGEKKPATMGVDWFACETECKQILPDCGSRLAMCCICQGQFCLPCADQFRLLPAQADEEFSHAVDLQHFDYGDPPPAAVLYVCPKCEGVDFGEPRKDELKAMLESLLQRFNQRRKKKLTLAQLRAECRPGPRLEQWWSQCNYGPVPPPVVKRPKRFLPYGSGSRARANQK